MSVLVVRLSIQEVDACSDWLFQLGATAIEDRTSDVEPTLVAGFCSDTDALAARSLLEERWPCRLEDTGDEADWRDRWLRYIEPISVAGFAVHAPWHDLTQWPELGDHTPLSIDPGRAFGSGHHPTTRLALAALAQVSAPGVRVLDVGSGTGILAVAAAQLGAGQVLGIDLDHDIVAVAEANAEANGVADRVEISTTPLAALTEGERFDTVVANIVISDLEPLLPRLPLLARSNLVISGFLAEQFDRMVAHVPSKRVERRSFDGWACAIIDCS